MSWTCRIAAQNQERFKSEKAQSTHFSNALPGLRRLRYIPPQGTSPLSSIGDFFKHLHVAEFTDCASNEAELFSDSTTTLLMPSVQSLGPMTMEQMADAIPSPLPFTESLMVVWPQLYGLIAATFLILITCSCEKRSEVKKTRHSTGSGGISYHSVWSLPSPADDEWPEF